MTKRVRIENADGAVYKVVVQIFEKGVEGHPDVLVQEEPLDNPTDLKEFLLWKERYLVIKEKEEGATDEKSN
jgi:hypothetical protein